MRKIPCPIKCVKFIVVDNQNFGVGTPCMAKGNGFDLAIGYLLG